MESTKRPLQQKEKSRKTIDKIIDLDGQTKTDDTGISQELNKHFSTIGERLASEIKQKPEILFQEEECTESIQLKGTNIIEVNKIITDLKNKSAFGLDNITKKDLLMLIDIIGKPVVNIINNILTSGQYPEGLKTAKIIPIHKKGPHDDANNYRPISILSVFTKITEKVINARLNMVSKNKAVH